MIKKLLDRKEIYVIISILLAFTFWFFVRQVEDPEQSKTINDVAVTIIGEDILEAQGLTIADLSVDEVSLQIYTNVSVLDQLNRDNLSVTVDVSKLSAAGEYELSYDVVYPTTVNSTNAVVENRTPVKITATVEKLYAETFPIETIFKGSIAEGYQAGEFTVSPDSVLVTGSVEEISQIAQAVVVLEREELTQRFVGDLPILLLDHDGNVLTDLQVEMSVEEAYVILPVVVVKEIPLIVSYVAGGGATEEDIASVVMSPEYITVSGAEEDMAGLTEISLGAIDLSKVVGTETFEFAINLDPSLTNVSGTVEASVTVTLNELATKEFDVTSIGLINVPDGYEATVTTQVRSVVVRGAQEALDAIDASQLRIVADMSHISAVGSTSIAVKVYLDATTDAGVIGDYTIIVNVTH